MAFRLNQQLNECEGQLAIKWQHAAASDQMPEICSQKPHGSELRPAIKRQRDEGIELMTVG